MLRLGFLASKTDFLESSSARPSARTSWHHIFSFNPNSFDYLRSLAKGSLVYVEANYELREADPTAEPESPHAQRQIFLRHGMVFAQQYVGHY